MGRQQVVPAVYHHLNQDKWGVADLTWHSYIPLDLKQHCFQILANKMT